MLKLKIQVNCDTTVVSPSVSEENVKLFIKEAMCSRLLEHTKFLQFFIQFKLKYAIKSFARCRLVLVVNKIHHSIISHITLYMPPCICTLHFHKFQLSDWL